MHTHPFLLPNGLHFIAPSYQSQGPEQRQTPPLKKPACSLQLDVLLLLQTAKAFYLSFLGDLWCFGPCRWVGEDA